MTEPTPERLRDIAHIGPVEMFTPVLEASRDFFVNSMALREVRREGDSIYLHTWDDYQSYTIKLTEREAAGVGRTYLRAASPQALERLVARIEPTGYGRGYSDQEHGLGPTYLFDDPDGHAMGVYWEVGRYRPAASDTPALKNQAAAFPGRGANVRRLDHVNYLTREVEAVSEFLTDVLGARCTERIARADGGYDGVWFNVCNKSYDLVYTRDWLGAQGRLHHIAFATDTREDILRAADVFLEAGVYIETGPHKHAIQQGFFLYVWEPGGNRIELHNPGARLILAPDWEPVTWTPQERAKGQAWGLKTIESFHTHGTPIIAGADSQPSALAEAALNRLREFTQARLSGRTILVIGLGPVGRETARLAKTAGMRVLAVNRIGQTDLPYVDEIRTSRFLGDLLPVAHAVVLALPLTDRTRGMIGAGAITRMRFDSFVINVGDAGVIDEAALRAAVAEGSVAGADLDLVAGHAAHTGDEADAR